LAGTERGVAVAATFGTRLVFLEARMYAVFVEVNAADSQIEAGREFLPRVAVPRARESGAKAGYWLAPSAGRGVSVVVFDTEETARQVAARFEVGQPPAPDAPSGVTVKTVEVREVLASLD
jgi:hypothetical protein